MEHILSQRTPAWFQDTDESCLPRSKYPQHQPWNIWIRLFIFKRNFAVVTKDFEMWRWCSRWVILCCGGVAVFRSVGARANTRALNAARFQMGHSRMWEHERYSGDLPCVGSNQLWSCDTAKSETDTGVSGKVTFYPKLCNTGKYTPLWKWTLFAIQQAQVWIQC